jgi:hypothetical protein
MSDNANVGTATDFLAWATETFVAIWGSIWDGVDYASLSAAERLERISVGFTTYFDTLAQRAAEYAQFAEQQGNLADKQYWNDQWAKYSQSANEISQHGALNWINSESFKTLSDFAKSLGIAGDLAGLLVATVESVLDGTVDPLGEEVTSVFTGALFAAGAIILLPATASFWAIVAGVGFGGLVGSWAGETLWALYGAKVFSVVSSFFTSAQRFVFRRDPLILDLDGDGIETVGVDPNNPILFDHDGDGIKNGTGWVKPDDGFLVLDRNGNGVIDNGTELFGDSTPPERGRHGRRWLRRAFRSGQQRRRAGGQPRRQLRGPSGVARSQPGRPLPERGAPGALRAWHQRDQHRRHRQPDDACQRQPDHRHRQLFR